MAEQQIRFDDGAAYERMMGNWSRLAGDIFLEWLAPRSGLRWIDIGCGNGAFTELLIERCGQGAGSMQPLWRLKTGSMQPLWRWFFSFPIRPKASPR